MNDILQIGMTIKLKRIIFCSGFFCFLIFNKLPAQTATINEETKTIKTYYFDEPDPVPILNENPKIYPYFKFEGYSHRDEDKVWKVVTLENDYIKLFVLPQVGGKVWGAIEKKTGEEFIYKNEVLKFRNIAMRGPWTSGGIEFNFGIIGHTPATATPVDYTIKENKDGSVSCIVGNIDLPSQTKWWVEINLQKDKAYFETKAYWYNPTPLNQSYYNWMTAAAKATNDLEFFFPGNLYLEHSGNAKSWPINEDKTDLSFYKNNNFGPHKSYHVVGDYKNFFGGYYHDTNFGFGHWSPYEEMPGQKLWLWALSRSGGIWEDLLTDTDGQYIEFQAGRLFNQYSPNNNVNPITQANFEPYVLDSWCEIWFPFKTIGGMVDASEYGVLNVEHSEHETFIGINALQHLNDSIIIHLNGKEIVNDILEMRPMDVFSRTIPSNPNDSIVVTLGNNKLKYASNPKGSLINRPFYPDTTLQISSSQKLYTAGWEALKYREYDKAHKHLSELIKLNPSHQEGLLKLAELEYRKTNYNNALSYTNKVLQMDTYNAEANYNAGIIYRAKNDYLNALECLGWAARSMKYRSVAYTQMAEIYIILKDYQQSKKYALQALQYNTINLNAKKVLLIISRKLNKSEDFKNLKAEILSIDPLNHFAKVESYLLEDIPNISLNIHNEFPNETVLELAIDYYNMGLTHEAIILLKAQGKDVKSKLWLAYLLKANNPKISHQLLEEAIAMPALFVSPYRRETIPVMQWALSEKPHWKLQYYLAQNYIAIGLNSEGEELLKACKNEPNIDAFYRFRASIISKDDYNTKLDDYKKALILNDTDWKVWQEFIMFYLKNKQYNDALTLSEKAYKKFPKNDNIKLVHAKALVYNKAYKKSIQILEQTTVLPSELSMESRATYFNTHVFLAHDYIINGKHEKAIKILNSSKQWPEHLGVGKPYDTDDRIPDFLLAICYEALKNEQQKITFLKQVTDYTFNHIENANVNHVFGLLALDKLGNAGAFNQLKASLKENDETNKMVEAFIENNEDALNKLKRDTKINEDLLELMHYYSRQ